MKKALLLYGATDIGPSHFSGDLLWRTGFKAPDPFFLIEIEGKAFLFASPLELERAEKEARADTILSLHDYTKRTQRKTEIEGILLFLKERAIEAVVASSDIPYIIGRAIARAFSLEIKNAPFYPLRALKTDAEIDEIRNAQAAVERALENALDFLKGCVIREGKIYAGETAITAEALRGRIDSSLYSGGYLGIDTIVTPGIQAADPHALGTGLLIPYAPIVIDIFPLSIKTHYYSDQTRTIFKGEPAEAYKKMYRAVLEAQLFAIQKIKSGVDGSVVYDEVIRYFESNGFKTDFSRRPMEGFFHGLGHGVGIDIHEFPRLGHTPEILEERNVVTVEPGLYYTHAENGILPGGIRIEDIVVVGKNSCENLTAFPKRLEDIIIP
ncbi:MAG: Xaa-Pro aminopeptidase [Parcubacteria group bacterium Gr01-1014_33]|nr:MAG: Xaa-Pro aminopeptidase [Parcubacteria group bacterium Gr01-1014_33]